jgi:hypothetical protein
MCIRTELTGAARDDAAAQLAALLGCSETIVHLDRCLVGEYVNTVVAQT